MIEKTIRLYNIKELEKINKRMYQKILDDEKESCINIRFDCAMDDINDVMKYNYNIDDPSSYKFNYSISYSQGDGVSFTSDRILSYSRLSNVTEKEKMNVFEKYLIDNLSINELSMVIEYLNCGYNISIIRCGYHYYHKYTCKIDYESFYSSDDQSYCEKMDNLIYGICEKLFNDVYCEICDHIEKMLYNYYEIDDYEVIEFLMDNEFLYTKEGYLL